MDSDVNMNSNVVRLNKWNVMEMMTEETKKMFFNNKCLKRRGALGTKALIGSVRVGSVHAELRPDPNSI